MKVYCIGDERYPYFWVTDDPTRYHEPYEIEMTKEEWKKYQEADTESERWQDFVENRVKEVRRKLLLENTKNGVEPKGFN